MGAIPFLATIVFVQDYLEQAVRERLATETGLAATSPEVAALVTRCVIPDADSNVALEARSTLRLATMIERSGKMSLPDKDITELLHDMEFACLGFTNEVRQHISRFGWLRTFTYLNEPFSAEEMLLRIANLLSRGSPAAKLEASERRTREMRAAADAAIAEFSDPTLRTMLGLARAYAYARSDRIDLHFRSEVRIRRVENRIAERLGLSRQELVHCTYPELWDALSGSSRAVPSKAEIRKRMHYGFTCAVLDGEFQITSWPQVRDTAAETSPEQFEWPLSGTTACVGVAEGRARLVLSANDMLKAQPGDILVTPMTTPDLMTAIEKCSGIVTDEGGMTCHAAIISRELRIPCIIGTQAATRVIPDGAALRLEARAGVGTVALTTAGG
jgi:phosphohistidine swiveling domain-containing protein